MSALHTGKKRQGDVSLERVFKAILDKIAESPHVAVASLILPTQKQV
jgi:predicted DNA-binding ribbon-helix-helix protein